MILDDETLFINQNGGSPGLMLSNIIVLSFVSVSKVCKRKNTIPLMMNNGAYFAILSFFSDFLFAAANPVKMLAPIKAKIYAFISL